MTAARCPMPWAKCLSVHSMPSPALRPNVEASLPYPKARMQRGNPTGSPPPFPLPGPYCPPTAPNARCAPPLGAPHKERQFYQSNPPGPLLPGMRHNISPNRTQTNIISHRRQRCIGPDHTQPVGGQRRRECEYPVMSRCISSDMIARKRHPCWTCCCTRL